MNKDNLFIWVFGIAILVGSLWWLGSSSNNSSGFTSTKQDRVLDERNDDLTTTRDEALRDHWDEIKEYVDGSSTIEACQDENCYSVEAQISDGVIEKINFGNGGYLYVVGEIEYPSGYSTDTVEGGKLWEFTFDMDSSMVDDAVQEWADDKGYTIE